MKKTIVMLFFIPTLLISCKYFQGDNCNNSLPITGVYENIYDKAAQNTLIINEDGTFEQTYNKDGVRKKNLGTWKFINESCGIYLNDLKLFHKLSDWKNELFRDNGKYRLNKIVFIEDLPKEFDFYRIE